MICGLFREWEIKIMNYQGSDPLALWYDYVCWYEQRDYDYSFETILGVFLSMFEPANHYKQDQRLVELWIKYVSFVLKIEFRIIIVHILKDWSHFSKIYHQH